MNIEILLIIVCSSLIFAITKNCLDTDTKYMNSNNFVIHESPSYVGLLFAFSGIILGVSIISYYYIREDKYIFLLMSGILLVLTLIMAFVLSYNKVIVDNNVIIVRKLFSYKEYDIKNITRARIKFKKNDKTVSLYVKKKKIFSFSESQPGYEYMCNKLNLQGYMD